MHRARAVSAAVVCLLQAAALAAQSALPGTQPLTGQGDLALEMVDGIHRYLDRALQQSVANRARFWQPDFTSPEAFAASVTPNRERFAASIGVVDERTRGDIEYVATVARPALLAETDDYKVYSVRWPVLEGLYGEGLLLEPNAAPNAAVVALPDCDQTPEMLVGLTGGLPAQAQFPRRLAEHGCRVIVPALINRHDTFSGVPEIRMTNQPHREYLYRAAFEMGRHIIGYEVQKVLAGVDWFNQQGEHPVGVIGYGEGGLIAFYAAAIDPRIHGAAVSGYFRPREGLWQEPIYRNVWALLREFGDAEIAALIAPRPLLIELSRHPEIAGPPQTPGRRGAAPGAITTPPDHAVRAEADRARALAPLPHQDWLTLVQAPAGAFGSDDTVQTFLKFLNLAAGDRPASSLTRHHPPDDPSARTRRQIAELIRHNEMLVKASYEARKRFWNNADAGSAQSWSDSSQPYRDYFWDEVIGRLPDPLLPRNPRTRPIYDTDAYTGYEVVLDVLPDVFAYGILLVPKDLRGQERRPVVVCQHGLEGRPQEITDESIQSPYHHYGSDLAKRGFIVYAPQNPYIGDTAFRQLQRKANPLKLSLFSFITAQHQQTLAWLASLPFVDPDRIALYGLSYGGKTAMRVPALLPDYCLSICSGDFNEWIWKMTSYTAPFSYAFTHEYEMYEFDLGNTFNYFEMSSLIFPRPFMVERGHDDGVSIDEWVAYEYAKVRRFYTKMGLGDRAAIEYFNGPHEIHGVGTFQFLHEHLNWPEP
jgi:dienelactone hydrolase